MMHYSMCDYLLDIVQNSVEANSSEVRVEFYEDNEFFHFSVRDNGKGMSEDIQRRALDPFYTEPGKHSARKAGFGLPFLVMAVNMCGGEFSLFSKVGEGTEIKYSFSKINIDTPPIGNFPETMLALFNIGTNCDIIIIRKSKALNYSISLSDLLEALGDLETVASLALAKDYLIGLEEIE